MEVIIASYSTLALIGMIVGIVGVIVFCVSFAMNKDAIHKIGIFLLLAGFAIWVACNVLTDNNATDVKNKLIQDTQETYNAEFVVTPTRQELTEATEKGNVEGPYVLRNLNNNTYTDVFIIADHDEPSVIRLYVKNADGEYVEYGKTN